MTSSVSVGESELQEQDPGVQSSQEVGGFKVPRTPASKKHRSEIILLREQMAEQQKQSKEQMALLERQMAEQKKQMAESAARAIVR